MATWLWALLTALPVVQTFAAAVIRKKEVTPFEEALMQDMEEGIALVQSDSAESQADSELQHTSAKSSSKLAVAVDYEGSLTDSKEQVHSGHTAMSVDAAGEILLESAQQSHKSKAEESAVHKAMERTLRADSSLKSDFSLDSSSATHQDRRRRCGQPTVARGRDDGPNPRHVPCYTVDCGPPPMAFMVALHNETTQLESFSSAAQVGWVTMPSGWSTETTRTELGTHMTPFRSVCSCDGCDEWNEWAIKELATPYSCEYPSHEWHLVFDDLSPSSTYDKEVQVLLGRVFSTSNTFTHNAGMSKVMAKQHFTDSAVYGPVATRLTADHDHAWEEARLTKETWSVQAGVAKAVWQYVLTCRVFNKVALYINEAKFHTPIKVVTQTASPPQCDPNVDGCATTSPHIVTC